MDLNKQLDEQNKRAWSLYHEIERHQKAYDALVAEKAESLAAARALRVDMRKERGAMTSMRVELDAELAVFAQLEAEKAALEPERMPGVSS